MKNINLLVSIIVPIYNVENYLDDCLISISKQSFKNIEIILVNDGSTDQSERIALNYINKDNRFKLYYKDNGGLSSARNFGLNKITGDYICFIDADDFISENFVSEFISVFTTTPADIVVCGRYNIYNDNLKAVFDSDIINNWSGREALINMMSWKKVDGSVCDKMFKSSDFNNLRFKHGVISEDLPITAQIFANSNLVIHTGKPNYYYRQRDGSITKQSFNISKLTILESVNDVFKIVTTIYPELSTISKQFILHHVHYLISIYFRSRELKKEDEQAFKIVRETFFKLMPIYFLPNGRNFFKKIILFFIISSNTQSFFRKFNKLLDIV